jgi:hypothetical protein
MAISAPSPFSLAPVMTTGSVVISVDSELLKESKPGWISYLSSF